MAGEVLSQVSRPAAGLPDGHADHMAACPVHALRGRLRRVGLRPTRQRVALGWLLFGKGDRHITAEKLYEEATRRGIRGRSSMSKAELEHALGAKP